jgi:hypothetical protein
MLNFFDAVFWWCCILLVLHAVFWWCCIFMVIHFGAGDVWCILVLVVLLHAAYWWYTHERA